MNQFVFKSRWIAIAFAVLTLFSAYVFIGGWNDGSETEGVEGSPPADAQVAQGTAEAAPVENVEQAADAVEFLDDEELIDDAAGEDPGADSGDGDSPDGGGEVDSGDSGFADADVPDDTAVGEPGPG